jgi:hypothetical protein
MTIEQEIVISRVSKKLKLPFHKVKEVFESDYRTMVNKIKEFDMNNPDTHHVFLIPKFGKFAINYKKAIKQHDRLKEINRGTKEE